jgi:hypothetical protein
VHLDGQAKEKRGVEEMKRNTLNETKSIMGRLLVLTALAFFLTGAGKGAKVQAQEPSIDRDNPTPLTSNLINGNGVGEKTEYFYSVPVSPGTLKIVLDVKADKNAAVSSVDISLSDANGQDRLSTYANPDHGSSKSAVKTVSVKSKQTFLLAVAVSPGVDTFKISFAGSLDIQPAADAGTDSSDASQSQPPGESNGTVKDEISAALQDSFANQTIQGTGSKKKTEVVYGVSAGPGDVTLQLNVKAQPHAAVSSVDIELLSNNQQLGAGFANPSFGETRQKIVKVHLTHKQAIALRVIVSPGVDNYTLNVSGALNGPIHGGDDDKTASLSDINRLPLRSHKPGEFGLLPRG